MKKIIIVGGGLSGMVLAFRLHEQNIDFILIDNPGLSSSSRVAAGLWNPLVFKRMSKSWMAEQLLKELHTFYTYCEKLTGKSFLTPRTSIKTFSEEQEKQLWIKRVEKELSAFADPNIHEGKPKGFEHLKMNSTYGVIHESGNLDMNLFLDSAKKFFKNQIITETFEYQQLIITEKQVMYKNHVAEAILFCEGYQVCKNPFFNWIPLKPVKGELLHIKAKDLKMKKGVFNKNGFLFDISDAQFCLGSTYNWENLNDQVSESGFEELKSKASEMIDCEYTITNHLAGVRPSSLDRRPIIGQHPKFNQLYVFNGLGAKGVMLAPYFARKCVHFIKENDKLPEEVDVSRFYHHYVS